MNALQGKQRGVMKIKFTEEQIPVAFKQGEQATSVSALDVSRPFSSSAQHLSELSVNSFHRGMFSLRSMQAFALKKAPKNQVHNTNGIASHRCDVRAH